MQKICPALELVDSYVSGVEEQTELSSEKYKREKESIDDEDGSSSTTLHQGLDSESWDLEGIFGIYFPNLQRQSALLTLCSFFESELNRLCRFYRCERDLRLDVSELKSDGLNRASLYLEKIAAIDAHRSSKEWATIKNIQRLRNKIVHHEGNLDPLHDEALIQFVDKHEYASRAGDGEVVLKRGFLRFVVETYRDYFKLLNASIAAEFKHQ